MKRIAALVDHSVYAASVCDHAAWLAGTDSATIDVVHIVNPFDLVATRAAGIAGLAVGGPGIVGSIARNSDDRMEELTVEGQQLVDRMTERLVTKAGVALGRVLVGEIRDVLKALEDEADILVVGKRGEDADFVSLSLGSNLESIVQATRTPLLMAPRIFRPISGWVLAFGGGPEVAAGVRHVVMGNLLPKLPCEIVYVGKPDEAMKEAMQAAQTMLSECGFPASIDIVDGRPVQVIAERMVSGGVRLVALGGFTRTRLLPALFGDGVATELTKASLAPVLLLR